MQGLDVGYIGAVHIYNTYIYIYIYIHMHIYIYICIQHLVLNLGLLTFFGLSRTLPKRKVAKN